MFIYEILNTCVNKRYIGQSTQKDKQRLWEHKCYLKKGTHQNRHLQRSWNKYGESTFVFSILTYCNTIEELNELEEFYVNKYNTLDRNFGYNIRGPGNNKFLSEETKQRISKSKSGIHVHTTESKNKLREYGRRKIHTFESKQKRSLKLKGYVWPLTVRTQWSKSHRKNKPYPVIISPTGDEYIVENMTWFCTEHNLLQQSMSKLVNKQLRHHRGWKIK